jgi:hypothetical protein
MSVYFHPRMPAPPEHDPKPGKRAFGWLVRYLQRKPPLCPCAACAARFKRLVPIAQPQRSSDHCSRGGGGDAHGGDAAEEDEEDFAIGDGGDDSGLAGARRAVAAWAKDAVLAALRQKASTNGGATADRRSGAEPPTVAAARTAVGVGEGKFQVDCAVAAAVAVAATRRAASSVRVAFCVAEATAARGALDAALDGGDHSSNADPSRRRSSRSRAPREWDVREQCGVVPAVLADPKLGWAGCATVGVSDALAPFLRHAQRQDEAKRNRGAALRRASAAAALDAFGLGRDSGGVIDYGGDDSDDEDADEQAAEQQQPPSTVVEALAQLARGARSAAASALAASAAFGPAAPASFGPAEAWPHLRAAAAAAAWRLTRAAWLG